LSVYLPSSAPGQESCNDTPIKQRERGGGWVGGWVVVVAVVVVVVAAALLSAVLVFAFGGVGGVVSAVS
jgi:hypothetical protein